jgi:putative phosphoribosyl transferase
MKRDGAYFRDRQEAGRRLAARLRTHAGQPDTLVLGLPLGGVPVAASVARSLSLPLDVLMTRQLPLPGDGSVSMGIIAAGGVRVLDPDLLASGEIPAGALDEVARREAIELARLERAYRGDRQPPRIRDRIVIVVDDGLTSIAKLRGSLAALRAYQPANIVVAMPVTTRPMLEALWPIARSIVWVEVRQPGDVATAYRDEHEAVSARDIRALLADAAEARYVGWGVRPPA